MYVKDRWQKINILAHGEIVQDAGLKTMGRTCFSISDFAEKRSGGSALPCPPWPFAGSCRQLRFCCLDSSLAYLDASTCRRAGVKQILGLWQSVGERGCDKMVSPRKSCWSIRLWLEYAEMTAGTRHACFQSVGLPFQRGTLLAMSF